MIKKINYFLFAVFVLLGLYTGTTQVKANPSQIAPTAQTATASTTVAYITAGNATTTLSYDAYGNGQYTKADRALLVFQYTASSTNPKLNARVEYSVDNIDWYPQSAALNTSATTTVLTGTFAEYQWNMATSTGDFAGSGNANRLHQSVAIEMPTRYVRVKFYSPIGGGNGALWAQIIPSKERAE